MLATEMIVLSASVVLLLIHIQIQGGAVTRERGKAWNLSSRDGLQPPLGKTAARAQRALDNYKETWPALIALTLALETTGRAGGIGAAGAVVWLVARVIYLPLYLKGVERWRTGVFVLSLAGIVAMLVRLIGLF
ncbi:MAPEG family protein [Sphingomonas sp. NFX23]